MDLFILSTAASEQTMLQRLGHETADQTILHYYSNLLRKRR